MATVAIPPVMTRRWTREEYYKMAEVGLLAPNERVELIEGEIVCMSPQKSRHAATVTFVAKALRAVFTTNSHVRTQLPLALGLASEPEPDVVVVVGTERDYQDAHPTMALLVVEVSDSTLRYDQTVKASLYANAGIPEYWVADLPDHCLEVRREPVPMPEQPFGYGYSVLIRLSTSESVSPLTAPQASIPVADLLP